MRARTIFFLTLNFKNFGHVRAPYSPWLKVVLAQLSDTGLLRYFARRIHVYASLTLARILVYAWFAHWLVPFRVNAENIRGNLREDAEQCGQCVKCLTKFSKCLKFVHDQIFELISRTIRELCVNYAQTSRTSACQCVPMRVHRPSDTLFTTSSRLSYEYFAHSLRILPSQFSHTSRTVSHTSRTVFA